MLEHGFAGFILHLVCRSIKR